MYYYLKNQNVNIFWFQEPDKSDDDEYLKELNDCLKIPPTVSESGIGGNMQQAQLMSMMQQMQGGSGSGRTDSSTNMPSMPNMPSEEEQLQAAIAASRQEFASNQASTDTNNNNNTFANSLMSNFASEEDALQAAIAASMAEYQAQQSNQNDNDSTKNEEENKDEKEVATNEVNNNQSMDIDNDQINQNNTTDESKNRPAISELQAQNLLNAFQQTVMQQQQQQNRPVSLENVLSSTNVIPVIDENKDDDELKELIKCLPQELQQDGINELKNTLTSGQLRQSLRRFSAILNSPNYASIIQSFNLDLNTSNIGVIGYIQAIEDQIKKEEEKKKLKKKNKMNKFL